MTATIISPLSKKVIDLAPGQGIAIYSRGEVQVSELSASPIHPLSFRNVGNVTNGIVRFGPYTDGATIQLSTSNFECLYEIGTSPNVKEMTSVFQLPEQPQEYTTDGVIEPESILRGTIIFNSPTPGPVTMTLPTGLAIEAASQWANQEVFRFVVINASPSADFTIIGDEIEGTFLFGNATVAANSAATFGISRIDFATFGGARTT